jgi:glycosyltransferase involved in cell wall biosynthesis
MTLQATVIIPTFEDWAGLQTTVDCLGRQSVVPEIFEVIVANNNPSSEVPPSLHLPSNARIIHVAKPGSYAARNAALREARGDVLFFTDSDCEPDTRWIEAGLAAITKLGPLGRVAGAVEIFPKGKNWTSIEIYDRVRWMRQAEFVLRGWCTTANLVTRRAAFDLVGLFSEDRFSGGDFEWNSRATKLGSEIVFSADTLIRHPARTSFADLAKKCRRLLGGQHHDERRGVRPTRPMASYLAFLNAADIRRIGSDPTLSDLERVQLMWIGFRLGIVEFHEAARLRYLSGRPTRS